MAKKLLHGSEAICEGAMRNGCRAFFGYPITPQSLVPEYMSVQMPKIGGVFIQAESEVSAINMVHGSAGAGVRSMTSSSSPGMSLKMEGISYIACAQIPCVIVSIMRSGPGLGGILPYQGDYFQSTKGGGHGDYRLIVLAPANVQEACDFTYQAFDIADKYRIPVMILGDGMLTQMVEPVELPPMRDLNTIPKKDWATDGGTGKDKRLVSSLKINADDMEAFLNSQQKLYNELAKTECRYTNYLVDDAEIIITAYGPLWRICKSAIDELRSKGVKVGGVRPITLFPFPTENYAKLAENKALKGFLTVELSLGQMVEDVRLAVNGKKKVEFYGRTGGHIPTESEIAEKTMEILKKFAGK